MTTPVWGRLEDVFVRAERDGEPAQPDLVRAESAVERVDPELGGRFLEFRNGHRYTGRAGSSEFRVVEFERHGVRIPERSIQPGEVGREGRGLAWLMRADSSAATAELHWRMAMPLACIMLALAALPLSHTTPRQGRYGKVAIALVIYLVYASMLVIARDAVAAGEVARWIGMWWAHGLTLVLVGALIVHRAGRRWSLMVLSGRARQPG
ncbi:MAG: LptF/LptG family permease [Halofilum sp. (in: g-proteobacteria)]|nr:LptF/LptG family permease [Halofilum sp. (in: g-proteobacteria)]